MGLKPIAVRLRANSSISTAQVPPLRGVRGVFVFLPREIYGDVYDFMLFLFFNGKE